MHIALDDNVQDAHCMHMRKVRRFIDGVLEPDAKIDVSTPIVDSAPATHHTEKSPESSAPIIKPDKKITSAPSGGGSRVGFGVVAQAPIEIPVSNPILRDTYSADINGVEEDVPCVDAADVTDEALEKERQRVQNILNSVLAMPIVTKPVKQKMTPENTNVAQTTSIVAMEADSTFANLDELKGIFHKDGGIAFGEGNSEAVVSNEYQNDVLFKEAELLGFDIRKESDSAQAMKFDFFGDADAEEPTATSTPVTDLAIVPEKQVKQIKMRSDIAKNAQKKMATLVTFGDIVRNALRFRRHK